MTEIRNVEQELSRFNTRLLAAAAFVLFGFLQAVNMLFNAGADFIGATLED